MLHLCARLRATGWILLVLYVAYAGQVIGGLFLGGVLSAFTGAVLMTPVAILVSRHRSGSAARSPPPAGPGSDDSADDSSTWNDPVSTST